MMMTRRIFGAALVLAVVAGCRVDMRDKGSESDVADPSDVIGTYVAADSGHTLGKDWCYSGALVLDSTKHFGSVLTMCSDGGSPQTEHLKGTYQVRRTSYRANGRTRVNRLEVILHQEGRGKTHTLAYDNGTLRFDEPWWLGAGLRALDVADPVLKKVSESLLPDTAVAVSSTAPGITKGTVLRAPKKSSKLPAK